MQYNNLQFSFEHNSEANIKSIYSGQKYRITLLFERMFRFEYQEDGVFEDRPTQTFWHRYQDVPKHEIKENENSIEIITSYWKVIYQKEQPFNKDTLQFISLDNQSKWTVNDDVNNYLGTARTLDRVDGETSLEKGLFSKEGFTIIDESNRLVYDNGWLVERANSCQDLYFFGYNQDFQTGLRDYYLVAGKTPLIPRFALGNWWSRYWNYTDDELKETILNFENNEIPLSVCIIDMDWHLVKIDPKYGDGWTGYTWNQDNFSNPKGFLSWLHNKNLKTSLNLHPASGIKGHEAIYPKFAEFMGIDSKTEAAIDFDCSDPKFMDGYFKLAHHPHEEMGVDFWWIDWQQGSSSNLKGLDPLWALNHMHYIDSTKNNKRGFIFSRWPGLGGHRYPIGFSGDTICSWASLMFQSYFTATASNVGFGWWSHDIGGHYDGIEDRELYVRWIQLGVFSPIFRLHSTKNLFHKREPWRWDEAVKSITKNYMQLRHELIPYIYSMAKTNSDGGYPLIRPLYYHHDDENAHHDKYTYYFGSELVISPFLSPTIKELNHSKKEVYLPDGMWFNYFDGSYYKGNNLYTIYGTLNDTPVFAKAGAIIPTSSKITTNTTDLPVNLNIDIFPGESNCFELYEDDGVSIPTNDNYCKTIFTLEYCSNKMIIKTNYEGNKDIIPSNRVYTFRIRSINKKAVFTVNLPYEKTYDENTSSWILTISNPNNDNIEITISSNNELILLFNDVEQKLTNVLLESSYQTTDKQQIGFIYKKYNTAKMGILALNIPISEKIERIKQLSIPEDLKRCAVDILKLNV